LSVLTTMIKEKITSYVGSEINDLSYGEKPAGEIIYVGRFDVGRSPSGGDWREYYLSIEDGSCILWDSYVDGDINKGERQYARATEIEDFENRNNKEVAKLLLQYAFEEEVALYDSVFENAKCDKEGLISSDDFNDIIAQLES
jgi:hypothetical protein